jgi:hypothetical protein
MGPLNMQDVGSPKQRSNSRPVIIGLVVIACVALAVAVGSVCWRFAVSKSIQSIAEGFEQLSTGAVLTARFVRQLDEGDIDHAYSATSVAFRQAVTREHFESYIRGQAGFHQRVTHFDFTVVGDHGGVSSPPNTSADAIHVTLVLEGRQLKVNRIQVNGEALP